MKFNFIENANINTDIDGAKYKFSQLLIELGLRKNNKHAGTGLGGNNFQLLVLMHSDVTLTDVHPSISVSNDEVVFNMDWLINSSMENIRAKLDEVFPLIAERHKYMALVFDSINQSTNLRDTMKKYQDHFPQLSLCLQNKIYQFDPNLSNLEQLIMAYILCQDLATNLDAGDKSNIPYVGNALLDFSPEIVLLAVRKYIRIERVIAYSLDKDPIFEKAQKKVYVLIDKANGFPILQRIASYH